MFREKLKDAVLRVLNWGIQIVGGEYKLPGCISFKYKKLDANGILIEEGDLGHNIVPDIVGTLMARLAKDPTDPAGGFTFLAVGTGDPGWDPNNPDVEDPAATTLVTEIDRKAFAQAYFVDPATGNPTVTPTNIVDFLGTFGPNEGVGALTELGVFGGDASSTTDSGTLVSVIHFPVKNKTAPETMTWTLRFTF